MEVFGAPRQLRKLNILPFIDARLHIFNDGNPAVNAGGGLRYQSGKCIWGINSYYDYRKTNHYHYNQYSLGLEMLTKHFDLRASGYLPLGKKQSSYYRKKFAYFEDHYAYINRKREFAMKGASAEMGYHIRDLKKIGVYGALGPYYFEGHGKNTIGGQGRINATFLSHIKLELSGSYDPVFKWIGQGEAGLFVSFGPKVRSRQKNKSLSYSSDIMAKRLTQHVDRQEIIVLDTYKKNTKAINPSTGAPYYFVFVNNESHSQGTFESPYTTIAQAANNSSEADILYIFPGSGASYD
ncbi:MAG: hypothetical protein EBX41_10745, partial [Chitinophagia bacterium]|nr:hypothetical protein [Chitinophagia bacterium]